MLETEYFSVFGLEEEKIMTLFCFTGRREAGESVPFLTLLFLFEIIDSIPKEDRIIFHSMQYLAEGFLFFPENDLKIRY